MVDVISSEPNNTSNTTKDSPSEAPKQSIKALFIEWLRSAGKPRSSIHTKESQDGPFPPDNESDGQRNKWSSVKQLLLTNPRLAAGFVTGLVFISLSAVWLIMMAFSGVSDTHKVSSVNTNGTGIPIAADTLKNGISSNGQQATVDSIGLTHQAPSVAAEFDDIAEKLAHIEASLSKDHTIVNVDQVRSDIANLATQVNQATARANAEISEQIKASTAALEQKLGQVNSQLVKLNRHSAHHRFLMVSSLPFKVMSIDNIQEADVVSVDYGHHVVPVDVGESIAGWTLVSANSAQQKAQFRNAHHEYVAINLNTLHTNARGA